MLSGMRRWAGAWGWEETDAMSRVLHVILLFGVLMHVVPARGVTMAEADRLFEKKRWRDAAKVYGVLSTRRAALLITR